MSSGLFEQAFRRPQRIVEIGAATLEFRGERTVQDEHALRRQRLGDRAGRELRAMH